MGSPLPAAVAHPRVRVDHDGAHGATRPTCPKVAKNGSIPEDRRRYRERERESSGKTLAELVARRETGPIHRKILFTERPGLLG